MGYILVAEDGKRYLNEQSHPILGDGLPNLLTAVEEAFKAFREFDARALLCEAQELLSPTPAADPDFSVDLHPRRARPDNYMSRAEVRLRNDRPVLQLRRFKTFSLSDSKNDVCIGGAVYFYSEEQLGSFLSFLYEHSYLLINLPRGMKIKATQFVQGFFSLPTPSIKASFEAWLEDRELATLQNLVRGQEARFSPECEIAYASIRQKLRCLYGIVLLHKLYISDLASLK